MAVNLAPFLFQKYSDANNAPLVGGKLYSYQAGTSTPQPTYTDASGVTPNTNPVIFDANGEASVWLDQSLSYKFILKNSNDVVLRTVDNVIGTLTVDAVPTSAIQDDAVTTDKIADDAVTADKLRDDPSVDANRSVTTDHIRNGAVTTPKIADRAVILTKVGILAPTVQRFISGSGSCDLIYAFRIPAGNATVGATYTNNGVTFTVYATIVSASLVYMSGSDAPTASGVLTKATGTGDSTLAFSSFDAPLYLEFEMVGAGGGGGGGGPQGGAPTSGTAGGDTTFGNSTAAGGAGGDGANDSTAVGGAVTVGAEATEIAATPGADGGGGGHGISSVVYCMGGAPGASIYGGAGAIPGYAQAGGNAKANSGSGGAGGAGGAGIGSGSGETAGAGGASGGAIRALIASPAPTTAYSIGAKGTKGTGSGNGADGGDGADGRLTVKCHYQ